MENNLQNEHEIKKEEVEIEENPLFTQEKHKYKVNLTMKNMKKFIFYRYLYYRLLKILFKKKCFFVLTILPYSIERVCIL